MSRRKTLAIILTVAMLLLAGCGSPADGSGNPVQDDSDATQPTNQTNQTNQSNTTNGTTQPIEEPNQSNVTTSGGTDGSASTDESTQQQNGDTPMTDEPQTQPQETQEAEQTQPQETQETQPQETEKQQTQETEQTQDRPDSDSTSESDSTPSNDASESSDTSDSNTSEQTQTSNMRVYAEDKAEGGYLTGAQITVTNQETGETYTGTTHTGEEYDGNYVIFENLPVGTYQLTGQADGYQNATNTVQLSESGRQPILQMPPASNESGGTVTLTIEDQDGEPITRGTVSITLPGADNDFGPRELQPNENGKVSFEAPVDENYYYGVTGQGINYDNNNGQINVNGDTQETIQVIEITHTLTVQANSSVTIERASDGATTTREPTSGAAGFTVLPGEYTISAEGYESQTVDVQDDTNVDLESTQPERSEVVISTTTAASGTGLESTVTLTGPDGETHSKETGMDGEVAFTVPPGEYEYELTPTRDRTYELGMFGYSQTITVGEEASTTHEFTFFEEPDPKDTEIEVVNAETGEPIEGATIEGMSPSMSNPYKPAFSVETEQNGVYTGTIPSAPSVQYDYSVHADGYVTMGGSMSPQEMARNTFELQPTESNQQTSSQESTSEESDTESSEETSSRDNSSEKSSEETSSQPTEEIESGNQTNSSDPAEA